MVSPRFRSLALLALLVLLAPACAGPMVRQRTLPPGHTGSFTTWWSDEVPKERGTYVDGERDGHVRVFHQNGALAMEGTFERGVPVGEIDYHRAEGGLDRTVTWADGRLQGPHVKYHPSGQVALRTEYSGGVPHGSERSFHPDGSLRHEGQWTRGLRSGPWRHLDRDGRLSREEHYFIVDGREAGYLETVYDEQGRPTVQTLMVRDDDVQRGWVSEWHGNGTQAALVEYRDGRRHGRDLSWSEGGLPRREGRLVGDLREGVWTWWDEAGRVTRQATYAAGQEVDTEAGAEPEAP